MNRAEHATEVSEWEEGSCRDCGCPFPRRTQYEMRCALCYKLDKGYNVLWGDQAFLWAQEALQELRMQLRETQQELKDVRAATPSPAAHPPEAAPAGLKGGLLRQVIILCHPDKHGSSEAATRVTQELLRLRSEEREAMRTREARKGKTTSTRRRKP